MLKQLLTATSLIVMASAAAAEDVALILANEDYDNANDVRSGDGPADAAGDFRELGFAVVVSDDADLESLREAVSEFGQISRGADRMLVVLSGRFVSSATETFFLPTDTGPQPLASLPGAALPLSTVLAILAEAPGQAVLALASDDVTGAFGPRLTLGIGEIDPPQGVTVAEGDPRAIERFLTRTLANPGRPMTPVLRSGDLEVTGFVGNDQIFVPEARQTDQTERQGNDTDAARIREDIAAWRSADAEGTAAAYRRYIENQPDGQFRRMAEGRLAALTDTPAAQAERTEQSLDLSRDERREIQRDLSLLDYNTRGIDGIFGRGTRAAIEAWQRENGADVTGFLTSDQIARLDAQAERRAAELEIEAERRRQEQLAADRAFWEETGAEGDEAGLTAYLERFPDGAFSDTARQNLEAIEREKRASTDALDRQLWDEARSQDTEQSYRDYLEVQPDGAFRSEAQARIRELRAENEQSQDRRAAAAEEDALNLSPSARRLIEQRLANLDLGPGRVDGVFDADTRRALRRYQSARDLPETGYLSEAVVVQLLADSVRSIFR